MSALEEIQEVIENSGQVDKLVELNFTEINIGRFTPQIKKAIEQCTNLEILILTACDLESLDNMPQCNLTAIDLTGNKLGDSELVKLAGYENLGQLIFNQNKVSKLQSIKVLAKLQNLQQVDFSENPVTKCDGYRDFVFQNLPKLQILDRFDREGNEQVEEQQFEDDEDQDEEEAEDYDDDDDQEGEQFDDQDQEQESPKPKKKR